MSRPQSAGPRISEWTVRCHGSLNSSQRWDCQRAVEAQRSGEKDRDVISRLRKDKGRLAEELWRVKAAKMQAFISKESSSTSKEGSSVQAESMPTKDCCKVLDYKPTKDCCKVLYRRLVNERKELNGAQKEKEILQGQLQRASLVIQQKDNKIQDLDSKLNVLQAEIGVLNGVQKEKEVLQGQLQRASLVIQQKDNKIQDLDSKLNVLQVEICKQKVIFGVLHTEIGTKNDELELATKSLEGLRRECDEAVAQVQTSNAELLELRNAYDEAVAEIIQRKNDELKKDAVQCLVHLKLRNAYDEAVAQIQKKDDELQDAVKSLEGLRNAYDEAVVQVQTKDQMIQQKDDKIQDMSSKLDILHGEMTIKDDKIQDISSKLESSKQELEAASQELESSKQELEACKSAVSQTPTAFEPTPRSDLVVPSSNELVTLEPTSSSFPMPGG